MLQRSISWYAAKVPLERDHFLLMLPICRGVLTGWHCCKRPYRPGGVSGCGTIDLHFPARHSGGAYLPWFVACARLGQTIDGQERITFEEIEPETPPGPLIRQRNPAATL